MKRIVGRHDTFPTQRSVRVLGTARAILGVFAGMVFVSACSFLQSKDPYSDYYYSTNFIESIGFDRFVGNVSAVPATEVAGQWDIPYRYESWDSYDYITLAADGTASAPGGVADTVPSGLVATEPVYRLEIVNLIDGGNFETNENAAWSGTGAHTWITPSSVLFGTGNMRLDMDKGESAVFTTTAHAGGPGFVSTASYNVFFRYLCVTGATNLMIDSISQSMNPTTVGEKGYARFTLPSGSGSPPVFTFQPVEESLYNLYVDNFRIGRYGNMALRLKLRILDTVPALESGTYAFSIWVHADPAATYAQNPYPVDAFTVRMIACEETINLSTTSATYSYDPASPGWQKLTATLEPGALQFVEKSTNLLGPQAVLGLLIDFNQSRPGSVLLAQPELYFLR